jgi:hypothetical protein
VKLFSPSLPAVLVVVLLALPSPKLYGQVDVSVNTLVRVGVSLSGSQAGLATEVLSADLKRTGMISPVDGGSGEFLASGEASDSGLTGQLVSKRTGASVFSQSFSGTTRTATHQFADAITKAVTGLPGFASSKLAFISNATGAKELYLADIDGYNARAITHDGTISASPSLSHDGSKLAYTSYKSGYPDIYLIDLHTGSRTRIVFFPGINSGPSFSPDASQIAMTLSKDGNPEIYTLPLNGGPPVRITRKRRLPGRRPGTSSFTHRMTAAARNSSSAVPAASPRWTTSSPAIPTARSPTGRRTARASPSPPAWAASSKSAFTTSPCAPRNSSRPRADRTRTGQATRGIWSIPTTAISICSTPFRMTLSRSRFRSPDAESRPFPARELQNPLPTTPHIRKTDRLTH